MATASSSSASSLPTTAPRSSLAQRLQEHKVKAKQKLHFQIDTMVDDLFSFLTCELSDLMHKQSNRGELISPEHLSRIKLLVKDFAVSRNPNDFIDNIVSGFPLPGSKPATASTVLDVETIEAGPSSGQSMAERIKLEDIKKKLLIEAAALQKILMKGGTGKVDNQTCQGHDFCCCSVCLALREKAAQEEGILMLSEDEDGGVGEVKPPIQEHAPTSENNVSMNKVNNVHKPENNNQNNNNMEIDQNNDSLQENGHKSNIPPTSSSTQSSDSLVQAPVNEINEVELSDSDDEVLFLELVRKVPITNKPPPEVPDPEEISTITPISVQVNTSQGGTASISAVNERSDNSGDQNQDVQLRKQTNMEKKAKLNRHMLEKHSKMPYDCVIPECHFAYKSEPELSDHIRNGHPETLQFSCNFCQMSFSDYHLLYNHEQVAHVLTYRCPVCDFQVPDFGPVTNPMETVANLPEEGPVECPILGCGKWLKCKRNLKSHFDTHRNFKPYMCTVCNICYNHSSTAKRHIRNVHFNNNPEVDPKVYLVVLEGFMERTPNLSALEQGNSEDNMNSLSTSGISSRSSTSTPRPAVTSNTNSLASNPVRSSTPNLHIHPSTSKQQPTDSNLRPSTSKRHSSASNLARLPISKKHNSTSKLRSPISNLARPSASNLISSSLKPSSPTLNVRSSTSSPHISSVHASASTCRSSTPKTSESPVSNVNPFIHITIFECPDLKCDLKFLSRKQVNEHAEKVHKITLEKATTIGDTIPQARTASTISPDAVPATAKAAISDQNSSNLSTLSRLNKKVTGIIKAAVPSADVPSAAATISVVSTRNDEEVIVRNLKVETSPVVKRAIDGNVKSADANKNVQIVEPSEAAQSNSQSSDCAAAAASNVNVENGAKSREDEEESINDDIKTFSNAGTVHIMDSLDNDDADEETDGWQSNREEEGSPPAGRKRSTRRSGRLVPASVNKTVQKEDDETDVENLDLGDDNTRDKPSSKKRRRMTQNSLSTNLEMTTSPLTEQPADEETAQNITGVKVMSLQCNQTGCLSILDNRRSFYGHLFQVHNMMPFVCPLKGCEVNFENGNGLTEHIRVAHRNVYKWRCKKCSKIFPSCRQLYLHTRALHVEGRFSCAHCEHEGINRWEVFCHTRDEHGEGSKRCTECGRSFDTDEELRSHERSHYLGDREYWCKWPNCGYNSSKKHPLVKHIISMHFKVKKTNSMPMEGEEANQERRDPNEFIEHIPQILI